jgi:hypothetical protein
MAFKTNYSQQRGDRDRAKRTKQQEKLKKREEDAARRKAGRSDDAPAAVGEPAPPKAEDV